MDNDFIINCVIYQDDYIIVLNKPAGMAVHRGRGGGKNLEQYLGELQFNYPNPPVPAHRLDRDTSGCLILGRNKEALGKLGKMFMAKRISKTYWAIVCGMVTRQEGRIDVRLRKQSKLKHNWWMDAHEDGQPAITDYKVLGASGGFTFLELRPLTGRTHQLRVHCKSIGCPIVGDKIYGEVSDKTLHLHAREITIPQHDKTPIVVKAPPPAHMLELLEKCGYRPD